VPTLVLGPDDATLFAPRSPAGAPAMDPVLLDVLSREVTVHLGAIRDFMAKAGEAFQPLPEASSAPATLCMAA
jgi:hypothetical protein